MALLATVVAATGRSVTTLSGVGFMAFRALWDYDCLFSFILFSRRPTPFHTPIVCSVLSPLGVSTSSSILSPLAGFFSVEVLLPKVVLVIPAKTSRTGLKMSLLLILIVPSISTNRAVRLVRHFLGSWLVPSVVAKGSLYCIGVGIRSFPTAIHLFDYLGSQSEHVLHLPCIICGNYGWCKPC